MGNGFDALSRREFADVRAGALFVLRFVDAILMLAAGGNLWEVRDAYDLAVRRHLLHHLRHALGLRTRHTGVNLVEDDGRQTLVARQYGFQRQHETGYFTARSNEAYVLLGHVLVGRKEQRHVVGTRGVGLLARRELQRHTGMRHAQGLEQCHKVGR